VLNVNKDGDITAFGQPLQLRQLRNRLQLEADTGRPSKGEPSDRSIMIRADRRVQFKHIDKILWYCTRQNIRIWKIAFGAAGEKKYAQDSKGREGGKAGKAEGGGEGG
jgi:biopolymer transport protein ExbD